MVSCGPAPPCWIAFVTSSLRSSASRCLITPGTPTLDDSTERRATPAARLPPGTVNETIFASLIATRPVQSYRYGAPSQPPPGNIPPLRLTPLWRRGGVVTQRPAKPLTPVRFRSAPLLGLRAGGTAAPTRPAPGPAIRHTGLGARRTRPAHAVGLDEARAATGALRV